MVHLRILLGLAVCLLGVSGVAAAADDRPNILFITVDDMSCDSVGVYGCALPGTTPRMDRLASQGLRFQFAHVQVGNCKPSRNVMWSGRYPHTSGVEGFYNVRNDYPVLADLMRDGGYYTAIRGKVTHSTPYHPYPAWHDDLTQLDGAEAHIKDVASFGESTKRGIAAAKQAGKPFCLIVNISDPHKPFYSGPKDKHQPSRVFKADEVPIPGFLFDHPAVREELALYYSSVRRADDAVGAILDALEASGEAERTVVMFLSDHGMPLPFAKTQLYHHSTRTPWIVRWPNVVKAGAVDERHMISGIDALPTLLDIAGVEHPAGLQGRSFLPLLKGQVQAGRDFVIKEYNENAGGQRCPMRGVQTRRYLYLFNPWSDGERVMKTATRGTQTFRTMKQLAATDEKIAARLELFDHRVVEEFYDIENDPEARVNLVDAPEHRAALDQHRAMLQKWMAETDDPALEAFAHRDDRAALKAYMAEDEAASAKRRRGGRGGR